MDGNMLSNGYINCEFDSGNRLIKAGGHTYTYNAEDVRIRNLCSDADTTYTYNTNCRLSQLLTKTTNDITTKYVYGLGLIGEEKYGEFKTYHFDFRGSTVALTDECGNITDTFKYDTYGKMTEHIGNSFVILGYNGRDGVVTDKNGLIYMRARYYSPDMRRFINADVLHGAISDSTSLNRYSYVNGNPVSFVDPFGLAAEERGGITEDLGNFYTAVFVSDFRYNFPINYTGHTQLYFLSDTGVWYCTEFNARENGSLKTMKGSATVSWEKAKPPIYKNGKYIDVDGINYVVLTGDFNKSVELARQYEQTNFGRYNFLFNNCADYTNKILSVADIDGMSSQFVGNRNTLISIPILREYEMSKAMEQDSLIKDISNELIIGGDALGENNVFGKAMIAAGNGLDYVTNFVGDVSEYANHIANKTIDATKAAAATVTNWFADAWGSVFGRD